MIQSSRISQNVRQTFAGLESVRLSAYQLAEARVQMARAETIANLIYGAWIGLRSAASAVAGIFNGIADAYGDSALKAGMRQRDQYLSRSVDAADLERRLRTWQTPLYVTRLV